MTEQSTREPVYARAPKGVKAAALAALTERGRSLDGYIVACLLTLIDSPDESIAFVDEKWPAPRTPGRPRKSAGE